RRRRCGERSSSHRSVAHGAVIAASKAAKEPSAAVALAHDVGAFHSRSEAFLGQPRDPGDDGAPVAKVPERSQPLAAEAAAWALFQRQKLSAHCSPSPLPPGTPGYRRAAE